MTNNEDWLSYSPQAINVLPDFEGTAVIIYVEGKNDLTFWDERFRSLVPKDFYSIIQVQGKEKLEPHIKNILSGIEKKVIIARDADYSRYDNTRKVSDPRIIMTYGHSIENTMFCPVSVAIYIKRLSYNTTDYLPGVKKWFNDFCESAKALLPYEIENSISKHKDNLRPIFKKNPKCYSIDDKICLDNNKVQDYISSIKESYDEGRINIINEQIKSDDREIRFLIQGHFLEEAVSNFIRHVIPTERKRDYEERQNNEVKQNNGIREKISFSNESLYESFSFCKGDNYDDCKSCRDKQFLVSQIKQVYDYFKRNQAEST